MLIDNLLARFATLMTISVVSIFAIPIQEPAQAQTNINRVKFNRCRAASQLVHIKDLGYRVKLYRINDRGFVIAPPEPNTYSARVWKEEECWELRDIYTWFLTPPDDDYEMCLVGAQLGLTTSEAPRGIRTEVVEAPQGAKRRVMYAWRTLNCNFVVQQYYRN
ncbi:MAG: hypothetical protein QNJ36_18520 [Calothrix sp. MO_167.B42]|nr:hypothetical protein [Calothrix sp. MO_167.B42]